MTDRKLAKEVAAELRRGQTRRRLTWLTLLAAAIAACLLYLHFGTGGGEGSLGLGTGLGETEKVEKQRCSLRVDDKGLSLAGKPAELVTAVTACKSAGGADLLVTGGARLGEVERVKAGLASEGVPTFVRGVAPR